MEFFDTTITQEAKNLVMECLASERVSSGKMVERFESILSEKYPNSFTVNSGTSALHMALILAGVGQGDEVIIPAQTFVATGLAILYQRAVPIFCDIEYHTGNIDPNKVVDCISKYTKAVMAVSWGGQSPELKKLREVCDQYDLKLIVDNAHAFGTNVKYEDFSCFSFQAIKSLTTGDGGLVVCKNSEDCEMGKRLSWFGIDRKRDLPNPNTGERMYNLYEVGYKYHMNDIAAALGIGNLYAFKENQLHRKKIADYYEDSLPKYSVLRNNSMDWLYTLLVDRRTEFVKMMTSKNIPVSVVHLGIHKNKIFSNGFNLPVQKWWDSHHICIPLHVGITESDAERVVDAIKGGW